MAKTKESKEAKVIPIGNVHMPQRDLDKKEEEQFFSNPANQLRAANVANQIQQAIPNWFTCELLQRKFKLSMNEAIQRLESLTAFMLCVSKVENGVPKFKIDISGEKKIELLKVERNGHELRIIAIDQELEILEKKFEESQKKS